MHSTFLSLKARNRLTVRLGPEEYALDGERKLFQAYDHGSDLEFIDISNKM
jgi:hypothetical protein